ncbi:MAG: dihydroorotase [Dehalococcoidia bacterium]|nr:dihydroorotase [Dehalococcoidia bacterium]MCB9484658.1 dihydroorotase [Thermoflexaceae bacterium]
MSDLLIRGGRVLVPARGIDAVLDVRVRDGVVTEIGTALEPAGGRVIDAEGCIVTAGFVDLHAHLREPGFEQKGTIATETEAALRGGFTTICAMPNTEPAPDSAPVFEALMERLAREARVRVFPLGSVTRRRAGKELSEIAELAAGGCVAISDDGNPVADGRLMRNALALASAAGMVLSEHCDDPELNDGGVINEGRVSERLGLAGQPVAAEVAAIARNIALCEATGARLHIAHVTTARGIELVAGAKARGLPVTCEVTPSHLFLTEDAVAGPGPEPAYDTNARINPPLRTEMDRWALVHALNEGTIDAIATDHAPHAIEDKLCEFDYAAPGIACFETAAGTLLTQVARGELQLARVIEALTSGPVLAWGLDSREKGLGSIEPGGVADIVVLEPGREWTVDATAMASKGKNTPLQGATLTGRVRVVVVGGEVRWESEESDG